MYAGSIPSTWHPTDTCQPSPARSVYCPLTEEAELILQRVKCTFRALSLIFLVQIRASSGVWRRRLRTPNYPRKVAFCRSILVLSSNGTGRITILRVSSPSCLRHSPASHQREMKMKCANRLGLARRESIGRVRSVDEGRFGAMEGSPAVVAPGIESRSDVFIKSEPDGRHRQGNEAPAMSERLKSPGDAFGANCHGGPRTSSQEQPM